MSNTNGARPAAAGSPPDGLFTDLYELNMAQALVADGFEADAEFELFFRDLGPARGYAILAGVEAAIADLAQLQFSTAELDYLASLGSFGPAFLDWLSRFRFRGDIDAMPEGSVVFAHEPLMRVRAPLPVAQIVETRLLNALHQPTLVATKAARIVDAADGRGIVDFGARRAHSADAATTAARSAWLGGCQGTSNMVAGRLYDLPVLGTMAHSYVQAWGDELAAFRAFTRHYPDTVLLIDTYDTLGGLANVIRLAAEQGDSFSVRAVRIDSGDLDTLARECRQRLDAAGLGHVRIIASGALNEFRIRDLVAAASPIDSFGVGTDLVVSRDLPNLDFAYKLVSYAGRPTLKGSPDKATLPGAKQVWRHFEGGRMIGDTIAGADEPGSGEALLQPVVRGGERARPAVDLDAARERAACQRACLPAGLRAPQTMGPAYPVEVSAALRTAAERLLARGGQGSD